MRTSNEKGPAGSTAVKRNPQSGFVVQGSCILERCSTTGQIFRKLIISRCILQFLFVSVEP